MLPEIRPLALPDLDAAEAILAAAFPRPANRRAELERGVAAGPDGWLLAVADGTPVGLVGALACGRQAWVGLMAVHPRHQSRGIGRALMTRALAGLEGQGVDTVILDASPAGRPLYLTLGFAEEDDSWMLERAAAGPRPPPSPTADLHPARPGDRAELVAFEAARYGADRAALLDRYLAELGDRVWVARDGRGAVSGFLCAQDGRLGPWLAASPAVAEALLERALALPFSGPVHAIVPGRNPAARALLESRGFRATFANRHLRRGPGPSPERREEIHGQSGFAFG